jgi:hypothetical protein
VFVALPTVHDPLALIVGTAVFPVVSFDTAVTANVAPLFAVDGAPVKLTVGVTLSAVTCTFAVAAE